MQVSKFVRKPFEVEAVQVTAENLADVATWCRGEVRSDVIGRTETELTVETGSPYVKVTVARALNEKQTKAFVGDWVLKAGTGFKVYTTKAFTKSFQPSLGERKDAAVQAEKGSPVLAEVPPTSSNVIAGSNNAVS